MVAERGERHFFIVRASGQIDVGAIERGEKGEEEKSKLNLCYL
jgi:hypothetical protein